MSSETKYRNDKGARISETTLNTLFTKNDERIQKRITEVLKTKGESQNILLAMDFDECAINEHLSRLLTEPYEHRAQILDEDKYDRGRCFNC